MEQVLTWDESKRRANLAKHGLDFSKAGWVLDVLDVLTVIHSIRDGAIRIISFRPASGEEREVYYDWLESE